jgi:hypothetical protein
MGVGIVMNFAQNDDIRSGLGQRGRREAGKENGKAHRVSFQAEAACGSI